MKEINIKISGEYIKLESLIKLSGVVSTGGQAKMLVIDGKVKVDGEVCFMRGKKLRPHSFAEYEGIIIRVFDAEGK